MAQGSPSTSASPPELLADRQACIDRVTGLLTRATRQVDVAARRLDPALYDRPEVVEALRRLVVGQRQARIRLLVLQPEGLEKRGHRLLELAFRLSSYFEARRPAEADGEFNEGMLIIDEAAWMHQQQADRYDGSRAGEDLPTLRILRNRFDTLWTHAEGLAEFRRLML